MIATSRYCVSGALRRHRQVTIGWFGRPARRLDLRHGDLWRQRDLGAGRVHGQHRQGDGDATKAEHAASIAAPEISGKMAGKLAPSSSILDLAPHRIKSPRIKSMANKSSTSRPLLGAHMSIAGGVSEALIRARDDRMRMRSDFHQVVAPMGLQALPRGRNRELSSAISRESGIQMVVAHDSYLINMGAPDEKLRKKSVAGFIDELERCEALGVPFLIAHPGSHVGAGRRCRHRDHREIARRGAYGVPRIQGRNRDGNHCGSRQQSRLLVSNRWHGSSTR